MIEKKPFGEIARVQGGYAFNSQNFQYSAEAGIPVVRMSNLKAGILDLSEAARISSNVVEGLDRFALRSGDFLFGMTGSLSNYAVVKDCNLPAYLNQRVGRFLPSRGELGYARQIFCYEKFQKDIAKAAAGAAQANISGEQIESLMVFSPPVSEQRKIATILEAWDCVIENLGSLISSTVLRRLGLMQQLLTGKTRFKEFTGDSWRTVRIGSLLEEFDRYFDWSDDTAYRFASIRRRSGGLFDRGTFYGREVKTKVLKTLKAGDFVISKRQVTHGAWAMVTKPFDGFGVSDEYDVLVNRDAKVLDMRFFNYLSQTRRLWHMAYLASNGVHIEKLIFNFDDFAKEKIKIPPTVDEQEKIVDMLSASDREIELLEKQLEALKEQKRGLMQKLLTGEVRVKI
jgi:type I restriction enzyme, S subunit